jgi:hypothetical protein
MNLGAKSDQFLKRHGVVGPVFCGSIIIGSIYGAVIAVRQIKTEWGHIKKNSRQGWKEKLLQKPATD